jgi:hypothetical protein
VILLLLLLGCRDEADEWRCVGPLVDLVRWRDTTENQRIYGGRPITPAALQAEERAHLEVAVEALRPRIGRCRLAWSVLLFQPPENPGLRLREEAMLVLLGEPPKYYSPEAVGWAGVTVGGHLPDPSLAR